MQKSLREYWKSREKAAHHQSTAYDGEYAKRHQPHAREWCWTSHHYSVEERGFPALFCWDSLINKRLLMVEILPPSGWQHRGSMASTRIWGLKSQRDGVQRTRGLKKLEYRGELWGSPSIFDLWNNVQRLISEVLLNCRLVEKINPQIPHYQRPRGLR